MFIDPRKKPILRSLDINSCKFATLCKRAGDSMLETLEERGDVEDLVGIMASLDKCKLLLKRKMVIYLLLFEGMS